MSDKREMTEEEFLAMQDQDTEDQTEETMEDNLEISQELQDDYGSPEPEAKLSAHSFLHKATFDSQDTVRTTFLESGELGRPLFTVRTMLDLEDIANYYLNPMLKSLNLSPDQNNFIARYFKAKIGNVTDSGMSNKGFAMNLNVTQKKDLTKKRSSQNIQNLKGGSQ